MPTTAPSTTLTTITEILKAITPLAIAAFVAWIAFQQWQTAHRKLRLDLYDRRFRVIDKASRIILNVVIDFDNFKQLAELMEIRDAAYFLFDPPIFYILDDVVMTCLELVRLTDKNIASADEAERAEMHEERLKFINRITGKGKEIRELAKPYLDFSRIR